MESPYVDSPVHMIQGGQTVVLLPAFYITSLECTKQVIPVKTLKSINKLEVLISYIQGEMLSKELSF